MQSGLPMHRSPRCRARTRKGSPCRSPAVNCRNRCRMHGGAKGSGGQLGNSNAKKHGRYTQAAVADRRALSALLREARDLLSELE